jgi:hypothetical protein
MAVAVGVVHLFAQIARRGLVIPMHRVLINLVVSRGQIILSRFQNVRNRRILKISDLVAYRENEREIRRKAETVLPTSKAGTFKMIVYADNLESELFVALVKGEIKPDEPVLVRLQPVCRLNYLS